MDGFASAFGPRGDPRYPAESVENRIETFRGCGMWVECNGVRMDYDQDNIEYNHSPPNNPDCAKSCCAGCFGMPGCCTLFYCYVFISGLPLDLEPWIEHARQSPACAYLMNVKGKRFINDVIRACKSPVTDIGIQGMTVLENKARLVGFSQDQIDAAKAKKKGRFYFWEELEEAVEFHNADFLEQKHFLHYATEVPVGDDARTVEQLKCKICLSRYANTLISPCKHLVMCGQCAKATLDRGSLCPYCRQPVEAVTSLYFT
ncbi:baculoviral IAP repeat-containing protein 8-like [Paramacrobiotus metropolitanus]|uniref:baculoviral IAP repeat-containing protein 8-like n=1 Tax=Paramacrobiotus metropolitanus TaxID=2943436 RepID=UPI0024460E19|nr:baculoviral IAP repeat-containing protein 8-like [Paramacrobiotus metropolitanus]